MPRDRKLTMDELDRPDAPTHLERPKWPLVVILDDLRSRLNVGSIFRSADAFGVEELILCGFTPTPPHREIEKSALGATRSVRWRSMDSAVEAVLGYQRRGYHTLAVEQTVHAIPLDTVGLSAQKPLALVFGNELNGVSDAAVEACDACVVVPQYGSKHSLNVSVCAGILLWWATHGRP